MVCASAGTGTPWTRVVGVAFTPRADACSVTWVGQEPALPAFCAAIVEELAKAQQRVIA